MSRRCNLTSDPNCTFQRDYRFIPANCSLQTLSLLNEIFFYYCLVVVVVGILGNGSGLALLLWAKYKLRHYSLNSFLIAVYFCDLGFLLSVALQLAKVAKLNSNLFSFICQFSLYSTNVFMFVSQWSMWALSAERYLAICKPILMFHINTSRNTTRLLVLFVIIAFTFETWGHTVFDVLNLSEAAVNHVIPGIMIVAFTLGTCRGLRRHQSLFTELDPSLIRDRHQTRPSGGSTKGCETFAVISRKASKRLHRRERQTAWFLMTIVIVDTVLNIQNFSIRLFSTLYKSPAMFCLGLRTLHMISFMLYYLQYTLNVFYLALCPRGRYFVRRKHSSNVSSSEMMRKRSFDLHQSLKACNNSV